VDTVFNKIDDFVFTNKLISNNDKVLLALSGGGDSVFLFYYFIYLQKHINLKFECLHINHNLRGKDSNLDEKFCVELCLSNNIPLYIKSVNVLEFADRNKKSIEEAARILRYDELNNIKRQYNFTKIATAHNLDDNIETIIFRMIEGTGLKGLTGIPVIRDGVIIRPLLQTSKNEISEYLKHNNLKFRYDESNSNINYKRNYIRHKIIPKVWELNNNYQSAFLRTINILNGVSYLYYNEINDIIKKNIKLTDVNICINNRLIEEYNDVICSECIKISMENKFNYRFDRYDYDKINTIKYLQTGKLLELKDNIILFRDRENIIIEKKSYENNDVIKFEIGKEIILQNNILKSEIIKIEEVSIKNKSVNVEFIDYEKLDFYNLTIRKWNAGDSFTPYGMKGNKKISDFLTDIKVDAKEKKNQYVLLNMNEIVYVIGYRISEKYKISEKTKQVLKIWIDLI